jgi:RimJ/RimL family protein N-acetyltransferase
MTTIPVIDDIQLSKLEVTDLSDLIHHLNDPILYENTLTVPYPYMMEHAKKYLEHVREFEAKEGLQKDWIVRKNGKLIGGIGALYNYGISSHKSEIGYWISREHRGIGIMTAVIGAFVDYLFDHTPLIRIEANVFVGNHSSARALEKNNFQLEGIVHAAFIKNGIPKDTWLYAKLK